MQPMVSCSVKSAIKTALSMHVDSRVALVTLLLLCPLSLVADDVSHDEALRLREQGDIMSLNTLLKTLDTRYPDFRLLEVELERDDGRLIYEIELLTRERVVRELEVDARDGRILDDEIDD